MADELLDLLISEVEKVPRSDMKAAVAAISELSSARVGGADEELWLKFTKLLDAASDYVALRSQDEGAKHDG